MIWVWLTGILARPAAGDRPNGLTVVRVADRSEQVGRGIRLLPPRLRYHCQRYTPPRGLSSGGQ